MTDCQDCSDHTSADHTASYTHSKAQYLARLKRIEGQVRGIQRMMENEEYCIDVLNQVAAATGALQNMSIALMEDHLHHCVSNAIRNDTLAGDEKISEAMQTIQRMLKR